MTKIYTGKGDEGYTELGDSTVIHKNHPRVAAYGTIDELSSFLGLALSHLPAGSMASDLRWIQRKLFRIGVLLAQAQRPKGAAMLTAADIGKLEELIDQTGAELPPLTEFILPGGVPGAAHLHCARTVCRRAERAVAGLEKEESQPNNLALVFLNRLSDYLFCAARLINCQTGGGEEIVKAD
ncbi:MAG: cob(I)yrinic acid a,c-diamide adenosyltransferase [Firmicutes bacterium]|nr:cob(I)yrinic acid a,c-diamide adenosyltransferase [Bacillota bacterium]